MNVSIALLTQDLRLHDNPVLHAARRDADQVVPLFVLDTDIEAGGFPCPNRSAFLADCLADLDDSLRRIGGRLILRRGRAAVETARLAEQLGARSVHVAAGVSGFAQRREAELQAALGGRLRVHEGSVTVVAPGAVLPSGRSHYAVFTPYHRAWQSAERRSPLGAPRAMPVPEELESLPIPTAKADSPELPTGGEREARRRWQAWSPERYEELHDALADDGTSRLSPYLHFGCLSPTELTVRAMELPGPGAEAFVRQLAWRDFHHQVLAATPQAAWQDYRDRGKVWREDEAEAEAWRQGRTGVPIVDAGMRQLAREGWMHNRARLITASYLTKTLGHDWRVGARHFLRLLVDGDLANNQLNWQWVAGTGNDTRPNRVLNPLRQAERYDPEGAYVRRWCPELAHLPGKSIHRGESGGGETLF
ncbi:deoxyribodipyrimidine photolyase [Kitasatospora sp. MMS16-BH015]|uniref:cryptochrome/photolyase family protein n=1 Tax=Kitasatospora sp. MMS16-BH015 TaxID=2018025 RepID=UPI000CA321A2|nr:deoxyribodipyrimidine photo-lyase [Kitasatospora sp. MMS16-BH015]AUG80637.1 deoxyribodipyrimidine photolyase [Kitasatospora sp. MMS16-BH015]